MRTVESQPGIVNVQLDRAEHALFSEQARDMQAGIPHFTEVELLDQLQQRGKFLKERVSQITDFLRDMTTHSGVKVAIFDLGADTVRDIGPTPTKYNVKEQGSNNLFVPDIYRGFLVALADWYGYGYTTQQAGLIHNNVIPVEEAADMRGHSGNAKYELGLHVEDASFNLGQGLDISPDFLTLHFFRNPKGVPTTLSIPNWDQISPETRDLLAEEWFYNQTNPLQGGDQNNASKPVSIIYGPSTDPWVRLNASKLRLEAYEPDQAQSLREFSDHLNQRQIPVPAEAGQIVVFDNRRVLHGRAPYREDDLPGYDGTDRWQRRLTVSTDEARIQEFEESRRVVDPVTLFAKVSRVQA